MGVECGVVVGVVGVVVYWGWCVVVGVDLIGGLLSNVVVGGVCVGICLFGCGRLCGICVLGVVVVDIWGWFVDVDDGVIGLVGLLMGGGLDLVGLCGSGLLVGMGVGFVVGVGVGWFDFGGLICGGCGFGCGGVVGGLRCGVVGLSCFLRFCMFVRMLWFLLLSFDSGLFGKVSVVVLNMVLFSVLLGLVVYLF